MSKSLLNINNWVTDRETRVFFVQRKELPIVDIEIIFAAGSAYDGDKEGLSQLTNCMLNQSTRNYGTLELANKLGSLGVQLNLSSDRDVSKIHLRSLKDNKYLISALQILAEIVTLPKFNEIEFLNKKNLVLNIIHRQKQAPDIIARNLFYNTLYQHHPYAHPVLGTDETVKIITVDDLIEFHHKFYTANNTVINIVGDISKTRAQEIAEQLSLNLPVGKATPIIPPAHRANKKTRYFQFPTQQTYIFIGQVGISYNSQDYCPILLGNDILGGSALVSRLFNIVRVKYGLAYNIFSVVSSLKAGGPFIIIAQTRNSEVNRVLDITNNILNEFILKGPTPKELSSSKMKIKNRMLFSLAQNSDILNMLDLISSYCLMPNYLNDYIDLISKVNRDQIRDAFQLHFPVNHMVTALTGNNTSKKAIL